jgi:hypothetical protein
VTPAKEPRDYVSCRAFQHRMVSFEVGAETSLFIKMYPVHRGAFGLYVGIRSMWTITRLFSGLVVLECGMEATNDDVAVHRLTEETQSSSSFGTLANPVFGKGSNEDDRNALLACT